MGAVVLRMGAHLHSRRGAPDRHARSQPQLEPHYDASENLACNPMDSRQLEIFVTVAERLNLREAAKTLAISQPAISVQLQALESELGFSLLIRDKQRLVGLTPAGHQYLEAARNLLAGLRGASRSAAGLAAGKTAVLKVGIAEEVSTASSFWSAFRDCQRAHSHIAFQFVELTLDELTSAVATGDLDMAFTLQHLDLRDLHVTPLWSQRWYAVLPTGHPLAVESELGPTDLAQVPLVLGHSRQSSGGHRLIEEAFARERVQPQINMRAARRSTMLMLVASGVVCTFMPASAATRGLPGMAMVPFRAEPLIVVAISRGAQAPSALREFWSALGEANSGFDFAGPQGSHLPEHRG
ncbi:LysR family transcriptional regulator [Variovorax sp. KK3]|uniref:LysR family transcriptional regulator n=1 Tax=Variovorax sp. KK3 TaxID=1855728 RepID=UPI0009F88A8E|nr:LysR family transcriptional regulator [Variovorax sp. KK3]